MNKACLPGQAGRGFHGFKILKCQVLRKYINENQNVNKPLSK